MNATREHTVDALAAQIKSAFVRNPDRKMLEAALCDLAARAERPTDLIARTLAAQAELPLELIALTLARDYVPDAGHVRIPTLELPSCSIGYRRWHGDLSCPSCSCSSPPITRKTRRSSGGRK